MTIKKYLFGFDKTAELLFKHIIISKLNLILDQMGCITETERKRSVNQTNNNNTLRLQNKDKVSNIPQKKILSQQQRQSINDDDATNSYKQKVQNIRDNNVNRAQVFPSVIKIHKQTQFVVNRPLIQPPTLIQILIQQDSIQIPHQSVKFVRISKKIQEQAPFQPQKHYAKQQIVESIELKKDNNSSNNSNNRQIIPQEQSPLLRIPSLKQAKINKQNILKQQILKKYVCLLCLDMILKFKNLRKNFKYDTLMTLNPPYIDEHYKNTQKVSIMEAEKNVIVTNNQN